MVKRSLLAFCISGFLALSACSDPAPIVPQDEATATATPLADWTGAAEIKTPPGAIAVSVPELEAAYKDNEARAQSQYGGKSLLVTGTIDSITLGLSDRPMVSFVSDRMMSASLFFEKKHEKQAALLNKGETRSFICTDIGETMGSPLLRKCRLAE